MKYASILMCLILGMPHMSPAQMKFNGQHTAPKSADEEHIELPRGDSLYLKKISTGWEVGYIAADGKRSAFFQSAEIRSVSKFANGPRGAQLPWESYPVNEDANMWFFVGTEKGYQVIRVLGRAASPAFCYLIPGDGRLPKKFQHELVRDKENNYHALTSIQFADGNGLAHLLRIKDVAQQTLKGFRNLADDKGEKQFTATSTEVQFQDHSTPFSLAAYQADEKAHYSVLQNMTEAAAKPPVKPSSALEGLTRPNLGLSSSPANEEHSSPPPGPRASALPPVRTQAQVSNSSLVEIEHNNEKFKVYTVVDGERKGTFIQRASDKTIVTMSVEAVALQAPNGSDEALQLKDGILSHPALSRRIDLESFAMEAKFTPALEARLERTVSDEKGQPKEIKESAYDWAKSEYEDIRNSGELPIPTVASRKDEIEKVLKSMLRPRKATTVLVSDSADTGDIVQEALTRLPRTWARFSLDSGAFGDISMLGSLDRKIKQLSDIVRTIPVVWYAPNITNLSGFGKMSSDGRGFLDMTTKLMEGGFFKVAGTAYPDFYNAIKDRNVSDSLQPNSIEPLKDSEVFEAVKLYIGSRKGMPMPSDEVIHELISIAKDFNVTQAEPNRSIGFAEAFFTSLEAKGKLDAEHVKSRAEVHTAASDYYKMDPALKDRMAQRKKLRNLLPTLSTEIIGQEHIKRELYKATKKNIAGLSSGRGPGVSFHFDGPPGIGKTEMALIYAKVMGLPVVRIEINQYKKGSGKSIDDLLGEIAKGTAKNPFTVFILDEMEKGDYEVLEGLLAAMDNEKFTYYEQIGARKESKFSSLKNATVFMTANTLGDLIMDFIKNLPEDKKELSADQLEDLLLEKYSHDQLVDFVVEKVPRPLLDRTVLLTGFPLNTEGMIKMMEMKIKSLNKRIDSQMRIKGILKNLEPFLKDLVQRGRKEGLSSRNIIARGEAIVADRASDLLMDDHFEEGKTYEIELPGMTCPRALRKAK